MGFISYIEADEYSLALEWIRERRAALELRPWAGLLSFS